MVSAVYSEETFPFKPETLERSISLCKSITLSNEAIKMSLNNTTYKYSNVQMLQWDGKLFCGCGSVWTKIRCLMEFFVVLHGLFLYYVASFWQLDRAICLDNNVSPPYKIINSLQCWSVRLLVGRNESYIPHLYIVSVNHTTD